jgi:hypothetical protein
LNLQVKDQLPTPPATVIPRPQPHPYPNGGSNRHSVSGMSGLGSPVPSGRGPSLPVSQYAPRVINVADGSWVSTAPGASGVSNLQASQVADRSRSTKRFYSPTAPSANHFTSPWTARSP